MLIEWECPSWGCPGRLVTEGEPIHNTIAVCQPRPGDDRSVCGREMYWNRDHQRWAPHRAQPLGLTTNG
jgi:hypothetical protein